MAINALILYHVPGIFIIGGARSGKSVYAVELAKSLGDNVMFIATCIPKDKEMKKRVQLHREMRPPHWKTIEEQQDIPSVLAKISPSCEVVIIDCITFLIANLVLNKIKEDIIKKQIDKIADIVLHARYITIIVSNEVGLSVVPVNRLGRYFRDIVGIANQIIARACQKVYLMVSGIPLQLK